MIPCPTLIGTTSQLKSCSTYLEMTPVMLKKGHFLGEVDQACMTIPWDERQIFRCKRLEMRILSELNKF